MHCNDELFTQIDSKYVTKSKIVHSTINKQELSNNIFRTWLEEKVLNENDCYFASIDKSITKITKDSFLNKLDSETELFAVGRLSELKVVNIADKLLLNIDQDLYTEILNMNLNSFQLYSNQYNNCVLDHENLIDNVISKYIALDYPPDDTTLYISPLLLKKDDDDLLYHSFNTQIIRADDERFESFLLEILEDNNVDFYRTQGENLPLSLIYNQM